MSGTSGSYITGGGGVMLPAPKVQVYHPAAPPDIFVADGSPLGGGLAQVVVVRHVKVTVPGISEAVLDDLSKFRPKLELLRYTRLNGRENASSGNGTRSGGYVHPSHGPAASGNGSFTHGGTHGGVAATVQAVRPTEWDILAGDANIDVTQGMAGFMSLISVEYRDSTGAMLATPAVTASAALNRRNRVGSRFPYSRNYMPGYFEFRLSVVDPSDSRGKRIHGPRSERVTMTNNVFPFLPAGVDVDGQAQATVSPTFGDRVVNFWLGASSRLPSQ